MTEELTKTDYVESKTEKENGHGCLSRVLRCERLMLRLCQILEHASTCDVHRLILANM